MLFESNYDNRLAESGDGAKAGPVNGKQIILKHDSELKKKGKSNRRATSLDTSPVVGARSGLKASHMASKVEPISGKKQSKN